jgi:hypothetical protein
MKKMKIVLHNNYNNYNYHGIKMAGMTYSKMYRYEMLLNHLHPYYIIFKFICCQLFSTLCQKTLPTITFKL